MNCANHADVPAVAYCRTCGKPLCSTCARDVRGVIYCEECLASHLSGTMPPPGSTAVPPGAEPPARTAAVPALAAHPGIHSRRRRHVQRRIRQGLHSRADLRHPDLDGRSREWHLRLGHRGVRNLHADRGVSRRRVPARWVCLRPIRSASTTCSRGRAPANRAPVLALPAPCRSRAAHFGSGSAKAAAGGC